MTLPQVNRERRGHEFYPSSADAVPPLYATDHLEAADTVIRAHYFVGACDWWVTEWEPASGRAFGYACLGDPQCAEWGYSSLPDLEAVTVSWLVVERDLHWVPVPFAQVRHACGGGA